MAYATIPASATLTPKPYTLHIPDDNLSTFKQLLKLSPLAPETYENLQEDRRFGVTRQWMQEAKKYWEGQYDWRKREEYINSFPNFMVKIKDDEGEGGNEMDVHFVALFSEKEGALPVVFLHGWPGSFLEFLGLIEVAKKKYGPKELPYHIIAPSLPGYAISSGPPLDRDWTVQDSARIVDRLMRGLGLEGYVAQGGDIGSYVSRVLAVDYESCKAAHLNFCIMGKPEAVPDDAMNAAEAKGLQRAQAFRETGIAYALEHGTRPATIGLVLSASPIALLAWIGEKFLEWTDKDPSLEEILDSITLYWLTESFARCIHTYRQFLGQRVFHDNPRYKIEKKPFGYSWFPMELGPIPKSWAETTGNMVWHRQHDKGGHFAAMEQPELLFEDVEDFVKHAGLVS